MAAIWPAIAVAVVVSFVSVWLNDIAVSWGRDGVRRVIIGSVEDIIYGRLRQQRSYSTAKMSINVKGVEGRRLIRPTLSFQPGGEAAPVTVSAAEAEMRADAAKGTLTISCKNGTIHIGDVKAVFPDTIERVVPLDTVSRKETVSTSPSEIAMADFPRARADQIETTTRGKKTPKVENRSKEGRFINRRVYMTVTDGQGRTVGAGGVGDAIKAMAAVPAAQHGHGAAADGKRQVVAGPRDLAGVAREDPVVREHGVDVGLEGFGAGVERPGQAETGPAGSEQALDQAGIGHATPPVADGPTSSTPAGTPRPFATGRRGFATPRRRRWAAAIPACIT